MGVFDHWDVPRLREVWSEKARVAAVAARLRKHGVTMVARANQASTHDLEHERLGSLGTVHMLEATHRDRKVTGIPYKATAFKDGKSTALGEFPTKQDAQEAVLDHHGMKGDPRPRVRAKDLTHKDLYDSARDPETKFIT